MTNPNDLDRAYLMNRVFARFTKNVIEQWSDPNKDEDESNSKHETEDDYNTEHVSKARKEACFASTGESRPMQQEKIIVEGRTFNNYDDFISFMYTHQPDEEPGKESESRKREEQLFAIDTEISCKETTITKERRNMDRPTRDSTKEIIKGLFEIFGDHLRFKEPETCQGDLRFTLGLETFFSGRPRMQTIHFELPEAQDEVS